MSLSYLSKTVKPEPYIQPIDLNLMAKVLGTEQGKFDTEGQKIQNQIDQMGNLDVMRGVDKDYINGKVSNLVKNINDLGGVNLADENISSQIEGMGSDIYGDDKVITAIASTRQIRNLQSSYEKLKTDPKMAKYYSKTNEDYDYAHGVHQYLNNQELGASYQGASSASPYVDYKSSLMKALEKIKPNYTSTVDAYGNFAYLTTDGKTVTPDRIMATAADLLTADEKNQMEKDGWGAFHTAPPELVVNQSLQYNNQKLANSMQHHSDYLAKMAASADNPTLYGQYKTLAAGELENINALKAASKKIETEGLNEYQKNPDAYMANVYKDQFYRGLGERFAYSEVQRKITNNPNAMMAARMQQQEDQFNRKMALEYEKAGISYTIDPETGKPIQTGHAKGKGEKEEVSLSVPVDNLNDADLYSKTETVLRGQISEVEKQKADLWNSWFNNYLNEHPEISQLMESSQSGTGRSRKLIGEQFLERNGIPGIQPEELDFDVNSPIARSVAGKYGLGIDKLKMVREIYDNYKKLSEITPESKVDVSQLMTVTPGLKEVIDRRQLLDQKIAANTAKIQGVTKTIADKAGLSEAETNLLLQYNKNPDAFLITPASTPKPNTLIGREGAMGNFSMSAANSVKVIDPRIAAIQDKIKNSGVDEAKEKNLYYQQIANRPTYSQQTIDKKSKFVTSGALQNLIATQLRQTGDLNKNVKQGISLKTEQIEPLTIGRAQEGTGYELTANVTEGTGTDTRTTTVRIPLNDTQAKSFGFEQNPLQDLTDAVYQNGQTEKPLLITALKVNDKNYPNSKQLVANVRIFKTDLNDRTSYATKAQIVLPDGTNLAIPQSEGQDASETYAKVETYLTNAARQGYTLPALITALRDLTKNH